MRTATSTYTLTHIDNRLATLRGQGPHDDAAAEAERQREIAYLVALRERKSAVAADQSADAGDT